MNVLMPLRDTSPAGRAALIEFFVAYGDVALPGLRNVGVVHFARFDILDGKVCLFSVYDGDFETYVRDFIVSVGAFFNNLMGFVKDPPPLPVEHNVQAFIQWVNERDIAQLPESFSDITRNVRYLPRKLATVLHDNPNLQLFSYSNYPGVTAAQIREHLDVGW
jgi:hypothetical protein